MNINTSEDFDSLRSMMVKNQLIFRDISDKNVLQSMSKIPREEFVPEEYKKYSYDDKPLPIGSGQTISQPYVVAKMCQLLKLEGDENVLDIGVGSGYQAAVLSRIAKKVTAIEIKKDLAKKALQTLEKLGYQNINVIVSDATQGYPPSAPFDAIKSAAAGEVIPEAWKKQLKNGGRIVSPVRIGTGQKLVRITKDKDNFKEEFFDSVQFVPLLKKREGD